MHSTQGLSSRTGSSRSMRLVDVSQPGASLELSLLDDQVTTPEATHAVPALSKCNCQC